MYIYARARMCVCDRILKAVTHRYIPCQVPMSIHIYASSYLSKGELNNRETRSAKSTTCWYLAYL